MDTKLLIKLRDGIMEIDEQIADYESRIKALKHDREGMMDQIVELAANKTTIIECK